MTLPEKLKAWRELSDKATPGPWGSEADEVWYPSSDGDIVFEVLSEQDAEFIAAARSAVPELCDEVERLQSGYLTDEHGNEYVQVCILKEKINEQKMQLAEAKEVLQFYAQWEDDKGAYEKTYDRTTLDFNYPGKPKARALLEKWGKG